jgi:hypothetical protein
LFCLLIVPFLWVVCSFCPFSMQSIILWKFVWIKMESLVSKPQQRHHKSMNPEGQEEAFMYFCLIAEVTVVNFVKIITDHHNQTQKMLCRDIWRQLQVQPCDWSLS